MIERSIVQLAEETMHAIGPTQRACRDPSRPLSALTTNLWNSLPCCSLHARRSLSSEVSSCADKDVLTTTIDFLSRTGALQQCRLVQYLYISIDPSLLPHPKTTETNQGHHDLASNEPPSWIYLMGLIEMRSEEDALAKARPAKDCS